MKLGTELDPAGEARTRNQTLMTPPTRPLRERGETLMTPPTRPQRERGDGLIARLAATPDVGEQQFEHKRQDSLWKNRTSSDEASPPTNSTMTSTAAKDVSTLTKIEAGASTGIRRNRKPSEYRGFGDEAAQGTEINKDTATAPSGATTVVTYDTATGSNAVTYDTATSSNAVTYDTATSSTAVTYDTATSSNAVTYDTATSSTTAVEDSSSGSEHSLDGDNAGADAGGSIGFEEGEGDPSVSSYSGPYEEAKVPPGER